MNFSRYLLACFVVFLFIVGFEWAFHGIYLKDIYMQTASLWRNHESMQQHMPFMFGGQLLLALVLGIVFIKGHENKGWSEGLRFGLLMAALYAPVNLINYAVIPYPLELVVKWIVGSFVELTIVGIIFSLIYKPKRIKVN